MSEEKKRIALESYPKPDPRLLSVPNLCSMYGVFAEEQSLLDLSDPESQLCFDQLQSCIDMIIESLCLRLAENRQAEIDLGFGPIPTYGK